MSEPERDDDVARELEGYAFTFCKAAFLSFVLRRYTLLGTSGAAVVFYLAAQRAGVREWRCFAKPPGVTLFFAAVALSECVHLRRAR